MNSRKEKLKGKFKIKFEEKRMEKSNNESRLVDTLFHSAIPVRLSLFIMGAGQLMYQQWMKGCLYLFVLIATVWYMVQYGIRDIYGFFTLGTNKADPWLGTKGDDSILMLLRGLLAFIIIITFLLLYASNIRDVLHTEQERKKGKPNIPFLSSVRIFADRKFYIVALTVPVTGVLIFSVVPIVFMILISFTNYGGKIVPPELLDWIGFGNFSKILALSEIKYTFFRILAWNFTWAILTTAINYFGGLGLALLLNKKCVKGKKFWRAFPVLAYAVPGFITFLAFKFMFSYGGPINYYITSAGGNAIGFLDGDAGLKAKIIGFLVNAWISIPSAMLLATGILSNMNQELYEAASIDGATKWMQFKKITLPFVLFSTTPVLLTNFINNFNNFGVFYFLRGGLYKEGYFLANDTDLLINWLYNLSIDNTYYGIGAALSFIIFILTSIFSLVIYVRSAAYKKEDTFR